MSHFVRSLTSRKPVPLPVRLLGLEMSFDLLFGCNPQSRLTLQFCRRTVATTCPKPAMSPMPLFRIAPWPSKAQFQFPKPSGNPVQSLYKHRQARPFSGCPGVLSPPCNQIKSPGPLFNYVCCGPFMVAETDGPCIARQGRRFDCSLPSSPKRGEGGV